MMDLKQPRHPVTRHLYLNVRGIKQEMRRKNEREKRRKNEGGCIQCNIKMMKTRNEKNEEKTKGGVYNHLLEYDVMKLRAMRP